MSSSSESEDEEWIFYCDRPDWKDVIPVPQDDGPAPIVKIAYSDKFRDVYDYMRAMWKTDERSKRAFRLTEDAIKLNPANYTVWHFRRVLLESLKKDLQQELEYITAIIKNQPKNYQVWYHRGIVVKNLGDESQELLFTREILGGDAKNYHCWQHRQLVLNHFKLWSGEVDFTTELLEKDIRNNSAWNQRFYAVANTTGFTTEVIEREVSYTIDTIKCVPNNESSWNFLNGLLRKAGGLYLFENLKNDFETMLEEGCDSPYLLAFLVDFYSDFLDKQGKDEDIVKRVLSICDQLAVEVDIIRKEYWNYLKCSLEHKYI